MKARQFSDLQGQYLAFTYAYTKVNGRPPAVADFQRYFEVSGASAQSMITRLSEKGLLAKTPGKARSLTVLVAPDQLPVLV